jgi:glycine/D-amino acid oxidase-like deaminating enzyme/nitrite reductase/ring-hydroxylating ferredoxin subunit
MTTTASVWTQTRQPRHYGSPSTERISVDVIVVGGGITGVTTAFLLKSAGVSVALLEARHIGSGVTANTTGHITSVLDIRYSEIESRFGGEGARLVAESGHYAILQIAHMVELLRIDCGFRRVPGYLYTESADRVAELERELEAAGRAGLDVSRSDVPLPFPVARGLCFPNQAEFHPLRYLDALAARIPGDGCHLIEGARVLSVDEGDVCHVHLENGVTLSAERVVLATHAPLNRLLLQTKLAHYRSYVVSGPCSNAPAGLFWDTEDPYHYLRSVETSSGCELLIGGEDHKTGQAPDTEAAFSRLAGYAARLGVREITRWWSAQVVEPVDGLPFIGQNAFSERVYVATGFSGNGLTFGTIAALILSDACQGKTTPYAELYAATRVKPLAGLKSFLGENVDFPMHLIGDRVGPPDVETLDEVPRGQGRVVRVDGVRLAVYRDDAGNLSALSPVCTHLGCQVSFNPSERTWDCPCHGSRFGLDGSVLDGPAVNALPRRHIDDGTSSAKTSAEVQAHAQK